MLLAPFFDVESRRRQRKAIADGLRDSVAAFGDVPEASHQEIMDLLLITQYFDTLKELGEKSRASTIFMPSSKGASTATDSIRQGMLEAHASMTGQAQARAIAAQAAQRQRQ